MSNPIYFVHVTRCCVQKNPNFTHLAKKRFFWDTLYFIFRDNKSNFVWKYCIEGGKTGYKIWMDLTQSGKLKCGQFLRFVTTSDLFVQMSVFVKFIGFPKTGYLDITAVYHDTIQI